MNLMDELRAARPAHLGDRPVDPPTREAELARAMARPRPARRRRRAVKPVWGLGLAGAAAAVTAAVVVMSGNGTVPTPRAPDGGRPVAASPGTVPATRVRLSARDVLLAAAEKADRRSEGDGDYWHTATVTRNVFSAARGGYRVVAQERNELWTPVATGGEQWGLNQPLGARPATEEDRAAWERAGSPSEIDVTVPGKGKPMTLTTSPGEARPSHSPLVDGDKVFWLGRNVTMKDLRGLPGEPGELKRWLLRSYEGHDTESSSVPMSSDAWLFRVGAGLITDMPVTPQVRGAAFRMLAGLDTVKVIENVADGEGRQGTAVAVEERVKGSGVLENRLILDEATGQALGGQSVVVRPGGWRAGFEPGTVLSSTTVLEAGWTDTKPS
ncbi:CU044_5270 family protein [Nonomuraea rhodomycinica]|uniref:CU044_5270 family protein n=1 Tax=Nonomuraea rhodomycinica TaxID=1712872 RepID=A0A7Y6IQI4_9ACTN|nr:CU044_5270 family protein [Nonomuraea rhodomycinica]NUW42562.1 CU044_5270 family protein [Nonomuraea rhodomycinica]